MSIDIAISLGRTYPIGPLKQLQERKLKNTLPTNLPELCFDKLSLLATANPVAFEELRSSLINETIQLAGNNANLLSTLQNRLDQEAVTDSPRYVSYLRLSKWIDDYTKTSPGKLQALT